MSVKVPNESVEYQYKTHNKCQCNFCESRRCNCAKTFAVSQRAAALKQTQHESGCLCGCHKQRSADTFLRSRNKFDPDVPTPVNQTALNRSRGRQGVKGGNDFTIRNRTTKEAPVVSKEGENETEEALRELDRLERLLIEEHKARVKATLEKERLEELQSTGKERAPVPLPAEYAASLTARSAGPTAPFPQQNPSSTLVCQNCSHSEQPCPPTPPVQCKASHKLQDTLELIKEATRDPANPESLELLKRVANGEDVSVLSEQKAPKKEKKTNEFGNSMAANVRSGYRPVGSGLVWTV